MLYLQDLYPSPKFCWLLSKVVNCGWRLGASIIMLTDFHGNVCVCWMLHLLGGIGPAAWDPLGLLSTWPLVNLWNGKDLGLSSRKVCPCEVHCLERAALKSWLALGYCYKYIERAVLCSEHFWTHNKGGGSEQMKWALWEEVKWSIMWGAPMKASLDNFPSLQGSLFLPGKVKVETQLCITQDLYTELRQWQVHVQRANVVYNMHEQMSALSEIVPSALPVSAAHPLTINPCVYLGPFIQKGCFMTSTWRLL